MSSPAKLIYIAPPATPEREEFERQVKKFVDDNYKTLTDTHYTYNNTVHYHRCCNTFTKKNSPSRKGHNDSQTLSKFFGTTEDEVTLDLMFKLCLMASESLPGCLRMSIPTLHQHHQDYAALDKRQAEARAADDNLLVEPESELNTLKLRIAALKAANARLESRLEAEMEISDSALNKNVIYKAFLEYNNINPQKVLSGWRPVDGVGETITLRWPGYCPDKDGKIHPDA